MTIGMGMEWGIKRDMRGSAVHYCFSSFDRVPLRSMGIAIEQTNRRNVQPYTPEYSISGSQSALINRMIARRWQQETKKD
jgi:hypothetical protein